MTEPEPKPNHDDGKRRRAAWLRRGLMIVVTLGATAAIVLAWLPDPVPVDLAEASRGPLVVTVDEDGRTRVKDRYLVSAPLLANAGRIELRPGDPVQPGTALVHLLPLDPPLLDARTKAQAQARVAAAMAARRQAAAAVSRVETALQFAEREAGRQRALTGQGASSTRVVERAELEERSLREELSSARFGARVADYDYEMATAALGRLSGKRAAADQIEVTSPVAGRVLRVLQQSEGVVQPGSPLLELGDAAALEVVVDVLTSDAVRIKPGARVVIERWGGERPLRAHVRSVEPSAFTRISALGVEEQRVNVIIDLDDPPATWASLGDGYRVEARIVTAEAPNALRVPASAVFRHDEKWALYAVREGRAKLVRIEIGARNSEQFEVTKGLSPGQAVILHPGDRVTDGAKVQPR